ncbi:PKD domain-containing protein [Candidatus Bipolaricaulota bacterium]|nr:PKD domain-containing protein [Candidatus Bipolaricaulota bacterium]
MNTRRVAGFAIAVALASAITSCALLDAGLVAQFDVSPVIAYAGEPIVLNGGASHGGSAIVSYSWEVDGQPVASGREATITVPTAGRYSVRLVVEDTEGYTTGATQELVVYLRSGTEIFREDFSDAAAIGRWVLDPTWASAADGTIEYVTSSRGYALLIRSSKDRWHRRYTQITIPPLRTGQRIVFTCRIMTLQNQAEHTFLFAPARREIDSVAGSLPYFLFTSEGGDSWVREPTLYGSEVGHPIAFVPDVYRWHTYAFAFGQASYELFIDGVARFSGPWSGEPLDHDAWLLVLGEESLTEACKAYYDDVLVTIEE